MNAKELMKLYESQINHHRFADIESLISPNARFWFSSGTFHGMNQIQSAFEKTWNLIQNEFYWLTDLEWIAESETSATCIYTFNWKGMIDGQERNGSGRGTSVLRKEDNNWKIVHEHLSNFPK
jgi:ketosteroid isomerase-like protein